LGQPQAQILGQRNAYPLSGSGGFLGGFHEAGFLQDLFKSAHFEARCDEKLNGLDEQGHGFFFGFPEGTNAQKLTPRDNVFAFLFESIGKVD
jgi:hypothetical protein